MQATLGSMPPIKKNNNKSLFFLSFFFFLVKKKDDYNSLQFRHQPKQIFFTQNSVFDFFKGKKGET